MEDFVFAFESNLKPIVGQQLTLSTSSASTARARLELLIRETSAGHCDLVAHTRNRGFSYAAGQFMRDDGSKFSVFELAQQMVTRAPVTFTAVPLYEGRRAGVDRDEDGVLDAFDGR
jgi:hypothetical protein